MHWPRILVVEHDPTIRALCRSALRLAHFEVLEAGDGVEALRAIEAHAPALVVLDLDLPRLNGRDVALELRAHADTRHLPIVVITAPDAASVNQADVSCVLFKPVMPDTLVNVVTACLDKDRSSATTRQIERRYLADRREHERRPAIAADRRRRRRRQAGAHAGQR